MNQIKKTTVYVFFLGIYLCCLCAVNFSKAETNRSGDESHLWEEITINYHQDFTWKKEYSQIKNHACKKVYSSEHHFFLRCMASSHLLRPAEAVNRRHLNNGGMFSAMLRHNAMGKGFRYKETANVIKSIPHDGFVTGRFLIWKPNVRSYTFHNITTGSIVHINATPSHRFYVLNRKKFISIENILPSDKLITGKGESIALICPSGQHDHCGQSYNKGGPVPVYNLEVYNRHQYFVSAAKILVHNCTFFTEESGAGMSTGGDLSSPSPSPSPLSSPSPSPSPSLSPEESSIVVDASSIQLLKNLPDNYHETVNELNLHKMKGIFYRGDSRSPETIFKEGFQKRVDGGSKPGYVHITGRLRYAAGFGSEEAGSGAECLTNIYLIDFLSEYVSFKYAGFNYKVDPVPPEYIAGCIIYSYAQHEKDGLISLHKLVENERYTGRLKLVSS